MVVTTLSIEFWCFECFVKHHATGCCKSLSTCLGLHCVTLRWNLAKASIPLQSQLKGLLLEFSVKPTLWMGGTQAPVKVYTYNAVLVVCGAFCTMHQHCKPHTNHYPPIHGTHLVLVPIWCCAMCLVCGKKKYELGSEMHVFAMHSYCKIALMGVWPQKISCHTQK